MTYVLLIWTTVAAAPYIHYEDWKPLAEFSHPYEQSAQLMCEKAAKDLAITTRYRCVRTK
jgi:hypothetical protein